MTEKVIDYIREYIYRFFLHIADSVEAGKLAEALLPEVADEWDSSGDIDLALTRALVNKLVKD